MSNGASVRIAFAGVASLPLKQRDALNSAEGPASAG